jgi:hypothetical protein
MKARDKYIQVFGKIETLAEPISWPTGISNMLEWLLWSTNDVLGVTKTQYRKKIVNWSHDESIRGSHIDEKQQFVIDKINEETVASERLSRYERATSSIAAPREALRRAKYFSEDYLNKEFDIFWGLVSDSYLDTYYSQFISLQGGGQWFTHGNSGLFACSTDIKEMQMDNLSYSPSENILIANELKLGGKKNPDQILKYALMYRLLLERGFIPPETRFMLLFIGDKLESSKWEEAIEKEIDYCNKSTKSTAKMALHSDVLMIAKNTEYAATTWCDLIAFNDKYTLSLDMPMQQVEQKLLWGFNETLSAKKFMVFGNKQCLVTVK